MEVEGHGKHHDGFGDETDQSKLSDPENCDDDSCRE